MSPLRHQKLWSMLQQLTANPHTHWTCATVPQTGGRAALQTSDALKQAITHDTPLLHQYRTMVLRHTQPSAAQHALHSTESLGAASVRQAAAATGRATCHHAFAAAAATQSASFRFTVCFSRQTAPHHARRVGWAGGSVRTFASGAAVPKRKQRASAAELGMYGTAAAVAMIGFAYASVPLYKIFCAATGYGGTVAGATTVEEKVKKRQEAPNLQAEQAAAKREVTVWFNADVADDMPWTFKPTQESVRVHPGQSTLAFFTAHNKSDKPITGYSVYNVTPDRTAQYFNKIQCFCFEEQRLLPGETVDMPVFFYVDPEMALDWNCRNVNDLTLSYVFYKVDDSDAWEEQGAGATQSSGVKLHGPGLAAMPAGLVHLSPGSVTPAAVSAAA